MQAVTYNLPSMIAYIALVTIYLLVLSALSFLATGAGHGFTLLGELAAGPAAFLPYPYLFFGMGYWFGWAIVVSRRGRVFACLAFVFCAISLSFLAVTFVNGVRHHEFQYLNIPGAAGILLVGLWQIFVLRSTLVRVCGTV